MWYLLGDDTLVFCEAAQDLITYLIWILIWFEAISRLKVNLEKSEIIPTGRVGEVNSNHLYGTSTWSMI